MTLAEQSAEGLSLSQQMSQVCLRTPLQQESSWLLGEAIEPERAKPDSVLEQEPDDYLCSQDLFCTPDYITPVDNDRDKENSVPLCPPAGLTPLRGKRPRPDCVFPPESWPSGPSSALSEDAFSGSWYTRGSRLTAVRQRVLSPPCIKNPFLKEADGEEVKLKRDPKNHPFRARTLAPAMAGVVGGNCLSRYRDEFHEMEELGRGNFSKVFKVIKRIDGCYYAVKQSLRPLKLDRERKEALTEVQALAALGHHTNVLRYYSSWFEADHLYIQTELCDGTLSEHQEEVSEKYLVDAMRQIANAMTHIHSQGLVHMDIKPSNIYSQNGVFKLGDFGRATRVDCSISVEEGDARYLPLEILKDDYSDLSKADVFSLGATIYELARGAPLPASGAQFQAIRQGRLTLLPGFSLSFQNLLKGLMHPTAKVRPSASDLLKHPIFRQEQSESLLR